jgi:serine/threonine protein kinase
MRDRIIQAVGDRYEIEREIGRGGMGVVYRARDARLRRTVAIKVLPPELAFRDDIRSRFVREAQTAAQLSHPSIVPIYAVDEGHGLVWFVMGIVEGESLGAVLQRDPRPPLAMVRRVLRDVADALAYAHGRGIVHRDIKPDNILIDQATGRPVVTDFGIARAAEGDARLTNTGVAVGTPAYMSPEQAMGERELDGRSDVYALSVVGYQMLCGTPPFEAANTPAMLMKHISEQPRPIAEQRHDVPLLLCRAIERGMEKQRDDRWADAAAFRDALDAASLDGPFAVPEPTSDAVRAARQQIPVPAIAPPWRPPVVRAPAPPAPAPWGSARGLAEAPPANTPPVPAWMPPEWKQVRREWKHTGDDPQERRRQRRGKRPEELEGFHELPPEQRIRTFRRHLARSAFTVTALGFVNAITSPEFPWALFPGVFMGLGVLHRAGSLWADGFRLRDVFGRQAKLPEQAAIPGRSAPSAGDLAAGLAPSEVMAGEYGPTIRRAVEDQLTVRDALARLSPADRDLIPDVEPTVKALVDRVASLSQALHRLDEDLRPGAREEVEARLARARAEPASAPDRERKISLLERQRDTLTDLQGRRETLRGQLESAALMLQNIRLDLVALRSAGVQSAIDDVTNATQEARALSRDIAHVLDAAKQVRR